MEEAKKAVKLGETPIGCVVVNYKTKKIMASAHNSTIAHNNPISHAEMLAINQACDVANSRNLSMCDIYVTLEPCIMCASVISHCLIRRLYFGAENKTEGAILNGPRIYQNKFCQHLPEVYPQIMEEEAAKLMRYFFENMRRDRDV